MPRASFPCLIERCGKRVVKGIECDVCHKWSHPKCSGLKPEHYTLHRQNPGLQWVCTVCIEMCRKRVGNIKETEDPQRINGTNIGINIGDPSYASPNSYAEVVSHQNNSIKTGKQSIMPNKVQISQTPKEIVAQRKKPNKPAPPSPPVTKDTNQRKNWPTSVGIKGRDEQFTALEDKIKEISSQIDKLKIQSENVQNKKRTVLILNREEPVIKESRARRDIDKRRVLDILRIAGIPYEELRRVHRVGVWRNTDVDGVRKARPLLAELANSASKNVLLSNSERISFITKGRYKIVPDIPRVNRVPIGRVARPIKVETDLHRENITKYPQTNIENQRHRGSLNMPGLNRNSPVVIIEDVLEDETWTSCIQPSNEIREICVLEGAKAGKTIIQHTPLRLSSTPTNKESKLGFSIDSLLGLNEQSQKNSPPPRVLRPRAKEV